MVRQETREQGEIRLVLGLKPACLELAGTGSMVLPSEDRCVWLPTSILCFLSMSQFKIGKTASVSGGHGVSMKGHYSPCLYCLVLCHHCICC